MNVRPHIRYPFGLGRKFTLILVAGFLPLLFFETANFEHEYRQETGLLLNEQLQTAKAVSIIVDTTFTGALSNAQALASDPVFRQLDRAQVKARLRQLQQAIPRYADLAVVDSYGNEVATTVDAPDAPPLQIADRDYFRQLVATRRPVLSSVVLGRKTQRPLAVAIAPIFDLRGGLAGATIVGIGLDQLGAQLTSVRLVDHHTVELIDPTGQLAFHADSTGVSWRPSDRLQSEHVTRALEGRVALVPSFQSPSLPNERLGAFIQAPDSRWVVAVSTPTERAIAPVRTEYQYRLLILDGVVLLSAGLGIYISHRIRHPISRIVRAAHAIARCDLQTTVDVRTNDELETLAEAFNEMVRALEERTRNAEEFDRRREEFISIVAHDLRSPITVIVGFAQMLQQSPARNALPLAHQHAIDAIQSNAWRLNRLVSDLLDVSRIDTQRLSLELQPIDLNTQVQQTVQELCTVVEPHPVRVAQTPHRIVVNADPQRLTQVWTNLLTNAAKYSRPDAPIDVVIRTDDTHAYVSIVDQGCGIPPDELPHVFERYYHRDRGTHKRTDGLGLGLYISRGIVEAHGGRITVESEVGKGSTFTVQLPVREQRA